MNYSPVTHLCRAALAIVATWWFPHAATASEAGQGTFTTHLSEHPVHCTTGVPIDTGYTSIFSFDDKTVDVNSAEGGTELNINFAQLGTFTSTGSLHCVFDEGGTFASVAVNDALDFEFLDIKGEYMDKTPGIAVGDPFPFVGKTRCITTRTDDFKTLCEKFDLSFNGLSKAQAPDPEGFFHDFAGDFTLRAVKRGRVDPNPDPKPKVTSPVDGPSGDVPQVEVTFGNGVQAAGDLSVATLADAHGALPVGVVFPVRGTTAIDHGAGPVPFFDGGDERFVEIETDAMLPMTPKIEVCLPLPAVTGPAAIRAPRILHGEGSETTRTFVDRTSRIEPTSGKVCARVKSFSKFAVVTSDVCGGGQARLDGLLTVAGGVLGKRTVVVDGLTDCTQYPPHLPAALKRYCVPDADTTAGQCTVSLTVGVNRAGCYRVTPGVDPHSTSLDLGSYSAILKRGHNVVDVTGVFGPAIAALIAPRDATVGPADVVLPVATNPAGVRRRITTYRLRQKLRGARPGGSMIGTDRDLLTLKCLDPTA